MTAEPLRMNAWTPAPLEARAARPAAKRTYFGAAKVDRLHPQVMTQLVAADLEIKTDLLRMRSRSRELSKNNAYMKRYLRMLATAVVGPKGIRMEHTATTVRGAKRPQVNSSVEAGWAEWCRTGICTVDGRMSFRQVEQLGIVTEATDGEFLVRILRGSFNKFGFALQILDADQLDHYWNRAASQGVNEIRMGVEIDAYGRPVAYWIWNHHPRDYQAVDRKRIRVPASDIIHVYDPLRANQNRGVPWCYPITLELAMLEKFEESALVAAKLGADKSGFIYSDFDEEALGDERKEDGEKADEITIVSEAGTIQQLPPGYKFQEHNPTYPEQNFPPFVKNKLRKVASGLGCSYNVLANDYEAVNFSSLRLAVLEDRDQWRMRQEDFIDQFHRRVFKEWLAMAALAGAVRLPDGDLDRWSEATWRPRGWTWVDPLKEVQATSMAIANGLDSRTDALAEQGREFSDVLDELEEEKKQAQAKGVDIGGTAAIPKANLKGPGVIEDETPKDPEMLGAANEA